MSRLSFATRRVCIRLREDDMQELERMASTDMNLNEIIRNAIHSFVLHAKDRARAKIDQAQRAQESEQV